MERELFAERLHEAALATRDFARKFLEENLPDGLAFRVRLNSSYDGHPLHADEKVYPDDGSRERAREVRECTEEHIVRLLWRNEAVPEWIDLSVIGVTDGATLVEAVCCGRFTANENLLYHRMEGLSPFHVLGPAMPVGYQDGQKISIYDRTECWSPMDIDRLREHAHKVWLLDLVGDVTRDQDLEHLPEFSRMEILHLKDSEVSEYGLGALERHPKLRTLHIYLSKPRSFHVDRFPRLPALTELRIQNVSSIRWDPDLVDRACPNLDSVTIEAAGELALDFTSRSKKNYFSIFTSRSKKNYLSITAANLSNDARLPRKLKSLDLHLQETRDHELERILEPVEALGSLGLRGTPVGDAVLERLVARWHLLDLDVEGTNVSETLIRRLATTNPELRIYPKLT